MVRQLEQLNPTTEQTSLKRTNQHSMICQNSSNSATGWPLLLVVTFWLSTRIQFVQFNPYATSKSFSIIISSELLSIPDRLSFIWSATRDAVIRCQINPTYRYRPAV